MKYQHLILFLMTTLLLLLSKIVDSQEPLELKAIEGSHSVGFDQNKPLGRREVGGVAALPIWIEFMQTVLKGKPEKVLKRPEGIITLRIDPATGRLVDQNSDQGIEETFREGYAPNLSAANNKQSSSPYSPKSREQIEIPEQVF